MVVVVFVAWCSHERFTGELNERSPRVDTHGSGGGGGGSGGANPQEGSLKLSRQADLRRHSNRSPGGRRAGDKHLLGFWAALKFWLAADGSSGGSQARRGAAEGQEQRQRQR